MTRPLTLRHVPARAVRAHPLRSLVVLLLALAQAACATTGLTLLASTSARLSLAEQRLGADVLVYPAAGLRHLDKDHVSSLGSPVDHQRDRASLDLLATNPAITQTTHQLYLTDPTTPAADGTPTWVVGYDPATDFVLRPWATQGTSTDVPDGAVLTGAHTPVSAEGTTTLYGVPHPVAGHLEATGTPLDDAVLVPTSTLRGVIDDAVAAGLTQYEGLDPDRSYSAALLRLDDRDQAASVTAWVRLYVRRTEAVQADPALLSTATTLSASSRLLLPVTGAVWLLLLAAQATTQVLLTHERRTELSVWRAVGASQRLVSRVMLHESLLLHAAGALLGAAATAAVLAVGAAGGAGGGAGGTGGAGSVPGLPALAGAVALAAAVTTLAGAGATWLAVRRTSRTLRGSSPLTL